MSFLSIGRKGGNRKKKEKDGGRVRREDRDRVAGGKRGKQRKKFLLQIPSEEAVTRKHVSCGTAFASSR